jgi:hypothetical protein
LAAARPLLTRSLIRSRSNSAKPAMMLRMSLPLAGAEVEAQAGLSQDADLPAVQVVKGLHQALGAAAPAAELGDKKWRQSRGAHGARRASAAITLIFLH